MKKTIYILILLLPIFLISCYGSSNAVENIDRKVIKHSGEKEVIKNVDENTVNKVSPPTGNLSKELSATCSLDSQKSKILCQSHRTALNSSLKWTYQSRWTGNDDFEFDLHSPIETKTLVILQECIQNSCNEIEIIVDTSQLVTDTKNISKDQKHDDEKSKIDDPIIKNDSTQHLILNKKNKDGSVIKVPEIVATRFWGSWGRDCEGSGPVTFTNSPMQMNDIAYLTPMGQVVGAHITPIDHMYFEPFNRELGPDIYEVRAIQDGIIYQIGKREIVTDTGEKKDFADWRLDIAHNCTFTSYFDLMTSVIPEIEKGYEDEKSGRGFNGLIIKAGQLLGYTGGQTLDFGVYDFEIVLPGFITPSLYDHEYWKVHTVDPFQYFPEEISKELLKKMTRTIKPQAGKIDYDVDGTLSGNWFEQGTNGYAGNNRQKYWSGHLSVAPHELDPSYWRVGIGHLDVSNNAFLIKGNIDPLKVKINSGIVIYELYQERVYKNDYNYVWWDEPKKEDDVFGVQQWGNSQGIIMFQLLENRLLKSEVFIGRSKDDAIVFSENARLYKR
jgi:hypothetical protein